MNSAKIYYLVTSIMLLLSSYIIYFNNNIVLGMYGMTVDNNEKLFIAVPTFIVGLFFAYKFITTKYKKQIDHSICPNCKETFNYNELKNGKCEYCEDIDTVDIEEYYKTNKEE